PEWLDFPLFQVFGTQFPAYRTFMMGVALGMLGALYLLITRTRIGLVIQAALTHPETVEALGHNAPRIFMAVFGGRTAPAGLALGTLDGVYLLSNRTCIGLVIQAALPHPETVEALGHNVPRIFMAVFAGGTALAGLAGEVGGPQCVTDPAMALTLGPIIFVVVVVGGMGSLPGAFLASLLIGILDAFAVGSDRSIADLVRFFGAEAGPATFGWTLLKVKISQVAAILPYLLLV